MVKTQIKRQNSGLPYMESVERFGSIPIVETGLKTAENVYCRIKTSNRLFNWYFVTAEATLNAAIDSVQPAVKFLEGPLKRIDEIMCKSLDVVEQRVPLVYLPPEMMYWNTKEYMTDHIVTPVLKRADSVKHLSAAVLDSALTIAAADKIDGAISVADKYIDKYLPVKNKDDDESQIDDASTDKQDHTKEIGPIKAIHHGQRFSRKLTRRLTQRTIAEAIALKKQSREAIHILIYAAELIVTDPKLALQKVQELWIYLSADEPENQERPENLEQLIVLLTRESARRIVHLVNYTSNIAATIPKSMVNSTTEIVHQFIFVTNYLGKVTKVDEIKTKTIEGADGVVCKISQTYDEMQSYANNALERLAIFLSGRIEAEKITTTNPRRRIRSRPTNNNLMQSNLNGVY